MRSRAELRHPGDTESAAAHLLGDNTYGLDLLKIAVTGITGERKTRYGHNLAQVGMGAQQVACAAKAPAWLGLAAVLRLLVRLPQDEGVRVTVEHDRRTWEGRAWNVVVANAQFTGGGLRLSPRSFRGTACWTPSCSRAPLERLHAAPAALPSRRPRPRPAHPGAESEDRFEIRPNGRCR